MAPSVSAGHRGIPMREKEPNERRGKHMSKYEVRRERNDASRATAEHHTETWEDFEVELLEEGWGESTVPEIAELLGRTIEACRQKHYDLHVARERAARTKRAKSSHNSQWDRGWTSTEDMGF